MNKNICSTSGKFLNHTNFRFILHATRDDIKRKQFCQFSLNDKRISSEILRTNGMYISIFIENDGMLNPFATTRRVDIHILLI